MAIADIRIFKNEMKFQYDFYKTGQCYIMIIFLFLLKILHEFRVLEFVNYLIRSSVTHCKFSLK